MPDAVPGPTPPPAPPAPPAADVRADAPADVAMIATLGPDGLRVHLEGGGHALAADASVADGGTATAPNPFRLLLASLGSCSAMTMRMYADRKEWPLEGVRIELAHGRRRARPGEEGATDAGWIFTIRKRIELLGDGLDAEQRTRLLEIAERCPVNQALVSRVEMQAAGPREAAGREG